VRLSHLSNKRLFTLINTSTAIDCQTASGQIPGNEAEQVIGDCGGKDLRKCVTYSYRSVGRVFLLPKVLSLLVTYQWVCDTWPVTFPTVERHCHLACNKLYQIVAC